MLKLSVLKNLGRPALALGLAIVLILGGADGRLGREVTVSSPYTPKAHVYKGMLHCHSTNSDGLNSPADVVTAYRDAGYDFISISDHSLVTSDPGVPGILFISGVEVGPQGNDLLCVDIASAPTGTDQSVIDQALSEGSFVVVAHPNYPGGYAAGLGWTDKELEAAAGYHGVEVWNSVVSPYQNAEGRIDSLLTEHRRVYLVATDDTHDLAASYAKTASVRVFADALTVSSIMEGLKGGNFYSSNGASISSIVVSEGTMTIATDQASTIEFIVKDGAVAQSSAHVTSASYAVSGGEIYIRARVTRDSDGTCAWTNPVYVDRR